MKRATIGEADLSKITVRKIISVGLKCLRLFAAKGEPWLQRSWLPMLMYLFGLIIAYNHVIVPLFGTPAAVMPQDIWDVLKLAVGSSVVGRSAETGVRVWKGNKQ